MYKMKAAHLCTRHRACVAGDLTLTCMRLAPHCPKCGTHTIKMYQVDKH